MKKVTQKDLDYIRKNYPANVEGTKEFIEANLETIKSNNMKSKKVHKMDPYTISNQRWELDWVVRKMKREGKIISTVQVQLAKKMVGKSRRKVYNYLRKL